MDLEKSIVVSSYGMRAQGRRMRLIAENLANADSAAKSPQAEPYRRKTIAFKNQLDRVLGVNVMRVSKEGVDKSDFQLRHMPGHPAADANGYVKMPNVNSLLELADMQEAQRSYEANLAAVDVAKGMLTRTVDLLR